MYLAVLVAGSLFHVTGPYVAKDCWAMKQELGDKAQCLQAEREMQPASMPPMYLRGYSMPVELPK